MDPETPAEPTTAIDRATLLGRQPPKLTIPDALTRIRERQRRLRRRIVALDDDPTGSQSVHDVPLITRWSAADLRWGLAEADPLLFVLTNSRSLDEADALAVNAEVVTRAVEAAAEFEVDLQFVCRGDSTLRGHYPAETNQVLRTLKETGARVPDNVVLVPCFLEAGRLTVDDVQWVAQGDKLVPVAQTEFAGDTTFGFSHSNLRRWVEERSCGALVADDVVTFSLEDLRIGGPERVTKILLATPPGRVVVVNAAASADLESYTLGALAAEEQGRRYLYRAGPTLLRVLAGMPEREPLSASDLYGDPSAGGSGLIVVGSYAGLTTAQLEHAQSKLGLRSFELKVSEVLEPGRRAEEIKRVTEAVGAYLHDGHVAVFTSRESHGAGRGADPLEFSRAISETLVQTVRQIGGTHPVRFVLAKGGITSSDILTGGFDVTRARVLGQMLHGLIPVLLLPPDSRRPSIPYVIFPGNVGDATTLTRVLEKLEGSGDTGPP